MSEYITEEGKINDVNTVKAQADQTPEACSCACIQDLHNYVLTVDFINALQNIRTMISDALNNADLSEIYKKLLLEIRTKLTDVWKHVGLIEDESNTQSAVKQKLLNLPQSELRQGDTRVLTYAKTIEGETSPRQVNDLYVYLGQASGPDAIDEATETSEHISKKWVKILTTEFNADDSEDINLDDIIRRLKAMEDRIGEAIRIVTSIWAYLCKNWWEFVDTADTVQEITSKTNPVLAQNYYCKSDNNIYIYLRTGGTLDEPIMSWVPILNANNIPHSSSAWRHTKVVAENWNPATADAGEFFGQTVYRMGTFNGNGESTNRNTPAYGTIFVWLPTMHNGSGDIGSSAKWVPLTNENTIPQSWRHTKVVSAKPNEGSGTNGAGSFFGETRYSTVQEEKSEYNGDIYVWLPSNTGGTGGVGTNPKWFNITRNQAINNIKNYNPEYVQIDISPEQCSARLASACDPVNGVLDLFYTRIERYGQMVNLNLGYRRSVSPDKFLESFNVSNGAGNGSSYQRASPHAGWNTIVKAYTECVFFNRALGDVMTRRASHTNPDNAWSGIDDPNYINNFTFVDMGKLFLGYYSEEYPLPTRLSIDGVDYTERTSGKQKIKELLEKYNIPNTKPTGYIELARRFFAPSETIDYTCYCEGWPGNVKTDWLNACYDASGEDKVTAIYNVSGYLDPDVTTNNNRGMYRHTDFGDYRLNSVTGTEVANRTSDVACTSQNRIRPNGIIDSPFIATNITVLAGWGEHWAFRPYLNHVQGSHVGRSMSTVIDQSALL